MTLSTVSGHALSKLGVGGSRIGSIGNPTPLAETRRMLSYAIDAGINVFDTADIYGQGDSEREIGRAVSAHRDHCFVVTKIGQRFSTSMRLLRPVKPLLKPLARLSKGARKRVVAQRSNVIGKDFSPAYLRGALKASLQRLRLDHVDALLLHGPTKAAFTENGITDMLAEVQRSGLVRHFGISCDDTEDSEQALEMKECEAVQLPVNLLSTDMTADMGNAFSTRSVAVFAREVLRFHPNLTPVEALARYVHRDDITSTIVGVSTVEHLRQLHSASLDAHP